MKNIENIHDLTDNDFKNVTNDINIKYSSIEIGNNNICEKYISNIWTYIFILFLIISISIYFIKYSKPKKTNLSNNDNKKNTEINI